MYKRQHFKYGMADAALKNVTVKGNSLTVAFYGYCFKEKTACYPFIILSHYINTIQSDR